MALYPSLFYKRLDRIKRHLCDLGFINEVRVRGKAQIELGDKLHNNIYPLSKLIKKVYNIDILSKVSIAGLCIDSRKVVARDCFIALAGNRHNALYYAKDAVKNGAASILIDGDTASEDLFDNVPLIMIPNLNDSLALLAATFYNFPSNNLNIVGVTGTNGKTSTTFLLSSMLIALGDKTAVMGTIGYGNPKSLKPSSLTTEDAVTLHKKLSEVYKDGYSGVAMEVSSHGIKQDRIAHVNFDYLMFTNITPDHLDYHGSFDEYLGVKLSLFDRKNVKAAIVNWDDVEGRKIADLAKKNDYECVFYGSVDYEELLGKNMRYAFAENISISLGEFSFDLVSSWGRCKVKGGYLGMTKIDNVLAVITYLLVRGFEFAKVIDAAENLPTIPGRMQTYINPERPTVIVDYAHTPEALEQLLKFLKKKCENLVCIFGCGGNRDKNRRYGMGRVADLYASQVILTADNPRDEEVADINADIMSQVVSKSKFDIIDDRKEAICKAIADSSENDVIVIIGKGHEQYQIQNGRTYYHSDSAVVEDNLKVSK